MNTYTNADLIVRQIKALLRNDDPSSWRIGVGLIKSLGNPFNLGVKDIVIYDCTPKVTLEVIDYAVKNLGVLKDSCWTYPEINNSELVLYKLKRKPLAA